MPKIKRQLTVNNIDSGTKLLINAIQQQITQIFGESCEKP